MEKRPRHLFASTSLALILSLSIFVPAAQASSQDAKNGSASEGWETAQPPSGKEKSIGNKTAEDYSDPGSKAASKPDENNPPASLDKISDLEGCWVSEPNFKIPWTGSRYYYYYCFDKAGMAKSYAARLSNSGKTGADCHFGSSAELNRKGFVLTEGPDLNCPGWNAGVYDCELESAGVANCVLKLSGHKTAITLHFRGATVPSGRK
ncbi:MAG: hypothetical protein LBR53_04640 [Deltaproteobacteria bacterium]|jgi:hypothetical protein|nr:hypothetical protein [Deltaproteobacteria bacterium]